MTTINYKIAKLIILGITLTLIMTIGCNLHKNNSNEEAQVTEGKPSTTKAGIERNYDITGKASMKRLASGDTGKTMVDLRVEGLQPNAKYPVHIHNLPCAEKGGGGHYQHEKVGNVDDVNEIWLTFTSDSSGVGSSQAEHGHVSRPDAQSIVIHDSTADKARIACIDLK